MPVAAESRPYGRAAAIALAYVVLTTAAAGGAHSLPGDEAAYLAANDAAMSRMMSGMKVTPSGDVDRDFIAMMIPHHQGAIDMARAVLEHGRDERLKRIAQEIVVTQQDEIVAMKRIAEAMGGTTTARNK